MWAAGCILAEMLTGRMLFAGTSNQLEVQWPFLIQSLSAHALQKQNDIADNKFVGIMKYDHRIQQK